MKRESGVVDLKTYTADFHVHTLLSPCAAVEMTPHHIALQAAKHGVAIVAITDHNACDNVPAALEVAAQYGITVLPGMEVETREEVHVICLFDTLDQLCAWERVVAACRPAQVNDEAHFGAQFIVDAKDELIGKREDLLLAPLTLGLHDVVAMVRDLSGLSIAAHIDRPSYSIIANLGFIPPDLGLAAVEVSRLTPPAAARSRFPSLGRLPVITASDAHVMADFIYGPKVRLRLAQPTLAEVALALRGKQGRCILPQTEG